MVLFVIPARIQLETSISVVLGCVSVHAFCGVTFWHHLSHSCERKGLPLVFDVTICEIDLDPIFNFLRHFEALAEEFAPPLNLSVHKRVAHSCGHWRCGGSGKARAAAVFRLAAAECGIMRKDLGTAKHCARGWDRAKIYKVSETESARTGVDARLCCACA